jgi:FKBP-type peptidyl-prolyl cis-trans isomerase SlyD
LKTGDLFRFILNSEKAYGDKREEMIINVPVAVFEMDGKINEDICRVGNEVPMTDSEGNPITGLIIEITDTYVRMDFNHPMAGLDLFFSGKIVEVREATEKELAANVNSCSECGSNKQSGCSGHCG